MEPVPKIKIISDILLLKAKAPAVVWPPHQPSEKIIN